MRNFLINSFIITMAIMLICTAIQGAEPDISKSNQRVVIAYEIERTGNFLKEPGNVPIEFLRRLGRVINKNWNSDKDKIEAASIFSEEKTGKPDFLKPIAIEYLHKEQAAATKELLNRYSSEANELLEEIKPDEKCFLIKAVAETATMLEIMKELTKDENFINKMRKETVEKINQQVIPLLESSDYIVCSAILSQKGFEAQFRIRSLESKLANPKINHSISISNYINPDSLMAFAQTHPIESPAEIMADLKKLPNTESVLQMIASAGLDMQNDLIANSARESIFYFNFDPTGESGLPDARFVAPVPDIKKLENNLGKLKNLCMQLGVFVKIIDDKFKAVRLSYFMFPQYAVYAALESGFLVLATSQENLYDEMEFIREVKNGKTIGEKIEPGLQRYWRISFDGFNLQLQKFLQSPLMIDKGIPPIPNLSMLDDLGPLRLLTRLTPEKIDFSVFLPIKPVKD
ncbi:MAG: hypothetical protein Kow0029_06700 [Candidatus Rifleibacteriota bacterium]